MSAKAAKADGAFDTFEVDGKVYQIYIDPQGQFYTVVAGERIWAETYAKLKDKITRVGRQDRVRIALPATIATGRGRWDDDSSTLVDVTITGIHRRTRDVLYKRDDNGKAGSCDYHDTLMQRLSAEQKAEYITRLTAKRASAKAFEAFVTEQKYDSSAIKAQVAAAETKAGVQSEEDD